MPRGRPVGSKNKPKIPKVKKHEEKVKVRPGPNRVEIEAQREKKEAELKARKQQKDEYKLVIADLTEQVRSQFTDAIKTSELTADETIVMLNWLIDNP